MFDLSPFIADLLAEYGSRYASNHIWERDAKFLFEATLKKPNMSVQVDIELPANPEVIPYRLWQDLQKTLEKNCLPGEEWTLTKSNLDLDERKGTP